MEYKYSIPQPKTEITLKTAVDGDKYFWVYETHDEVVSKITTAKGENAPFVTFNRVQGIGSPGVKFSTRPDNIVNVRDISE